VEQLCRQKDSAHFQNYLVGSRSAVIS